MLDLRAHFSRFIAADPDRIHLAAHSHHYWPDVAREGQIAAWDEAARLADGKWERVMGAVWREAQGHVARHLGLPDPSSVVFGQNTFEFWLRLLSCFPPDRPLRILATDSEFHSFARLASRLEEDGLAMVERVPSEPFDSLAGRFARAAAQGGRDVVIFSQVLFNSGYAVRDMEALVAAVPDPATFVVIDGYHGFLARPTDLSRIAGRAFYLGGGYKYAMAGEGAAFMHCPPGYGARPRATGWYAAFSALSEAGDGRVAYACDAQRFMGATFDPTALYRLNAVMRWLDGLGIDARAVEAHSRALASLFIDELGRRGARLRREDLLLAPDDPSRGNFLTFRRPDAAALHGRLAERRIVTDLRGDRLRIGFGLHHAVEDARHAARAVASALAGA